MTRIGDGVIYYLFATLVASMALVGCGEPATDRSDHAPIAGTDGEGPSADVATTAQPQTKARPKETNPAARRAYFGELHVHSKNSFDAAFTHSAVDPEYAYKFARGDAVPFGDSTVRIGQPLDFMAITDHAMYLGVIDALRQSDPSVAHLPVTQQLNDPDSNVTFGEFWQMMFPLNKDEAAIPGDIRDSIVRDTWSIYPELARKYYEPGKFTTLVGYEWTSAVQAQGLHRNIIFRGTDVPEMPFSVLDSRNPEDLWTWMDDVRARGMELLAIPHNPNQSNGLMFSSTKWDGSPLDSIWAETRMRNEPLVEVTQIKGTSETVPSLSPNDEWAGFEILDERMGTGGVRSRPQGSYIRQAYKDGLALAAEKGFNPYRFGMIGSTDGHNAVVPAEENNYSGKMFGYDGTPEKRLTGGSGISRYNWMLSASGLAGVWASENTREGIFDALRRKEAFATSGPRIKVRLFAGWDFPENLMSRTDWVDVGYTHGVPMGENLPAAPDENAAPKFAVWAMKDPASAWLDRVQIIKGWIDADGQTHEKVIDVACSDGATPDPITNRCPDNGAGVDLRTCDISMDSGDVSLAVVWEDPDFEPTEHAFYYARVIENPTCRWSTWEALRANRPLLSEEDVPPTIQERAWSSPVWYSPEKQG